MSNTTQRRHNRGQLESLSAVLNRIASWRCIHSLTHKCQLVKEAPFCIGVETKGAKACLLKLSTARLVQATQRSYYVPVAINGLIRSIAPYTIFLCCPPSHDRPHHQPPAVPSSLATRPPSSLTPSSSSPSSHSSSSSALSPPCPASLAPPVSCPPPAPRPTHMSEAPETAVTTPKQHCISHELT